MPLSNLGTNARATDMGTTLQREIRSNERDLLLDDSQDDALDIDVSAGGTITLTDNQQYGEQLLRFTGSPAGAFTIELLSGSSGDRRLSFENSSGQTVTITGVVSGDDLLLEDGTDKLLLEDGSGTLLLETGGSITIPDGETRLVHQRGTTVQVIGTVGLENGALLKSGQVPVTGDQNWADNQIDRVEFKDYSFTTTSPSSAAGTLILDMENGNYFDVTLTENVTTLTLSNPPASGKAGTIIFIASQDAGGGNVITWPGSVIWEQDTGGSPDQTTSGNAIDIYMLLTVDAGVTWYGFVLGLDMK